MFEAKQNKETGDSFTDYICVDSSTARGDCVDDNILSRPEKPDSPGLILVRSNVNLGFSGGNNLGISFACKYLNPEYILLLNSDTIVKSNFLDVLADQMNDNPDVGICTPIQYEYPAVNRILTAGLTFRIAEGVQLNAYGITDFNVVQPFEVTYASGATMFIRAYLLGELGLLDETMFFGSEDLDFSLRSWVSGYRVICVPSSVVYHKQHISVRNRPKNWAVYYGVRSLVRTILKNLSWTNAVIALTILTFKEALFSFADVLCRRDMRTTAARIRGIGWNIVNLEDTLVARERIQHRRIYPDKRFIGSVGWDKMRTRMPGEFQELRT
jgi:GT2 family glycosyltransferase